MVASGCLRAGELQLEIGRVLTTDPFSFTAGGEAWRTQSWLAELGYAWLEDVTGVVGNRGDAWFRIHCERWAGKTQVWLWLAGYGRPADEIASFQRGFDELLGSLFSATVDRS